METALIWKLFAYWSGLSMALDGSDRHNMFVDGLTLGGDTSLLCNQSLQKYFNESHISVNWLYFVFIFITRDSLIYI